MTLLAAAPTASAPSPPEFSLHRALVDAVDAAVIATDLAGRVVHWSAGAQRLFGWAADEMVGHAITDLPVGPVDAEEAETIAAAIEHAGVWQGRVTAVRRDGTTFPALVRDVALHGPDGRRAGVVSVTTDVSPRVATERELGVVRTLSQAVADSVGEGVCVLGGDLRLRYMNRAAEDLLGWTLDEAAGLPIEGVVGAELEGLRAGRPVRDAEAEFTRGDGSPFPVSWTAAPLGVGDLAGVAFVFTDVTERRADRTRTAQELQSLRWIPRIRDALEEDRFVLHAQPIVDLATGETIRHELLIRMDDPDEGLVAPAAFLPVAEEHGLIGDIDRWVIWRAARLAGAGRAVELNVSAWSIGDPELLDVVERALRRYRADPQLMVFELTETALLEAEESAQAFVDGVTRLGCGLALDDFGTGYGGFTYLKRFPVNYLKIDIDFVRDLPRDAASRHVISAVVALARGFGQQTIAEGVEDAETLEQLRELGVDHAQGYFLGRPGPLIGPGFGRSA
jgi:PAS domain S-box-containing protein